MKNIIYAFLAVLMLISFNSCKNTDKENKVKKPQITIEHRKIEDFKGYNEKEFCFELVTRDRIYFAQIKDNKLVDTAKTENYFQIYPMLPFSIRTELIGEDKNYKIRVIPYDYGSCSVVFEDKKTGVFYFTIMSNPQGIYFSDNVYWIIGNDCRTGCYSSVMRIENPKNLTSHTNLDSLMSKIRGSSHEERVKVYEKAENIFYCNYVKHNLQGFIPYKNSMILFLTIRKEDEELNKFRKEYNISYNVLDNHYSYEYFTIQVHQDKSMDTLETSFEGIFFGVPYDACTILPKNQNSISFCQVVLEIENDTLFVYSLE